MKNAVLKNYIKVEKSTRRYILEEGNKILRGLHKFEDDVSVKTLMDLLNV